MHWNNVFYWWASLLPLTCWYNELLFDWNTNNSSFHYHISFSFSFASLPLLTQVEWRRFRFHSTQRSSVWLNTWKIAREGHFYNTCFYMYCLPYRQAWSIRVFNQSDFLCTRATPTISSFSLSQFYSSL